MNLIEKAKEFAIQTTTSGALSNAISLATRGWDEWTFMLGIAVPMVAVVASVQNAIGLNLDKTHLLKEVDSINSTLEKIQEKMKKHQIKRLQNYVGANITQDRYQFAKRIMDEAINAKTDAIQSYCASMIVWAGVTDYSEEIEYRKLYKCLAIVQQLDDLDIRVLEIYDLKCQADIGDQTALTKLHNRQEVLRFDTTVRTQEIKISINKLVSIGLLGTQIELASYEDIATKNVMITQIFHAGSSESPTPIYQDFNRYVHQFF
ncbi:hypothetical protein ABEX29_03995 [Brevibacillus porteri]|uniref:hypothetical protein n=1 Tax=Brevibacillus porteri TaxID=2126350 RepID=UPI003D2299A1